MPTCERPRLSILPVLAAAAVVLLAAVPATAEPARLMRFADVHGDRVAFVFAGDLWIVDAAGGQARRLTTHEGFELFPKFSPDGRTLAFSAEYGGNRQVWTMPVEGGAPTQLTWYNDVGPMPPRGGFDYRVLDWTRDGADVLVRANRLPWGVRMGRPYLVPADGGMERPLAVPETGGGMLSPDGTKYVYTPIDREFRTWKRYEGGRAQDVWIYDLETDEARQITDWEGTDNQPVWVGDTIYFTSDRADGRLNLWSHDLATGEQRQVTFHEDFDVLWPSAGPETVVYEAGGRLWIFDPATDESREVVVEIVDDFVDTMPRTRDVSGFVASVDLSPSGARAVVEARGDVFTVPAEHGTTRNLTRSQGVREMAPTWSPDGSTIAYLSDETGEYEIWLRDQDGRGEPRRVTGDGGVWRFPPAWSPDGGKLAWGDRDQRLRYVDVESGRITDVDRDERGDITTYTWAPGSGHLAYTKNDESGFSSIWLHDLASGENHRLTDDLTNDYAPTFDPKGRYLYLLSDRDYNLTFSGYEFNYLYTDPTRIYVATLQADGPALLLPKSDEETPASGEDDGEGKGDAGDAAASTDEVRIDVEGLADRIRALPGDPGAYRNLRASEGGLFFVEGNGADAKVRMFSIGTEKTETVFEGVGAFELSRDGKKLLWAQRGAWGIVDAKPGQKAGEGKLDLSGLTMRIDPRAEWRQIFADAWRITRDWFYDPGMHGLDWAGIRELYAPLVEHVRHRGDLDYILGEMGGELSAGHYYVNWGDMPGPERVDNGLLGAEIEPHESGYFRIASIMPGENWHPRYRSPLREPGLDVREGDFIIAIDGRSAAEVDNVYRLLEHKANRVVELTVNEDPTAEGARTVRVTTIAGETDLRYLDWAESRRALVDELSGGRIGYVHLPNTAFEGNRELRKFFYPQAHKDALIVDVRYNGGGFIPDRMIELVARQYLSFWKRRGTIPTSTPGFAHEGPKACLINAYSSSGGDAFPYYFRELDLGPLIGRRTWGGLIGLSGNPSFVDGGSVSVPTFRFIDTEGRWAVEGIGVAPDIDVLDRPDLVARGEDPTLERAVRELLDALRREPPVELTAPPAPTLER